MELSMSDRFVEVRLLRRGEIADTRLARMPSGDHAFVVVRTLRAELSAIDEVRSAFLRGSELASRLSHPNIVRIVRVGEEERRPFYAMEWLDGLTLHDVEARLRKQRRRPHPAVACGIASRVARALAHAHEHAAAAPLVHRSVCPDNVMLTRAGAIKVLEFGGARVTRAAATRSGILRASVEYCAPEELADLDVGPAADLFALGVVLWEMLVGRHPFRAASPAATEQAIREEPARAPSALARVPVALDALVLSLLAKFPLGRPRSAAEVADALDAFMVDLGVRDLDREVRAMLARSGSTSE